MLRQFPTVKLKENKNGVFVNLPFLLHEELDAIVQFVGDGEGSSSACKKTGGHDERDE